MLIKQLLPCPLLCFGGKGKSLLLASELSRGFKCITKNFLVVWVYHRKRGTDVLYNDAYPNVMLIVRKIKRTNFGKVIIKNKYT